MSTAGRLAAYGMLLAAVVAGGAAVGSAVGPIEVGEAGEHGGGGHTATDEAAEAPSLPAGGLLVAQDGFSFLAPDRVLEPGREQPFSFVIEGPDGAPVEDYQLLNDRELHLIIVSRDLARFAHLHPARDDRGTWTVDVPALSAGSYRAYADFQPTGGEELTLGTDLTLPGQVSPPVALRERRTATVDGYEVSLEGDPEPGQTSALTITVRRDGEVVTTDPYLGAAGHLVAIRDGDLAYLHVHPEGDEPRGPVPFAVEVPSAGTYGLYFDFAHEGTVQSAGFVLVAGRHGDGLVH